jgi:3-hydroxyacyl-CoA dehydrogenase/3a,7a,12a-trihydroxy-5b-cholest-24-enoyl-CoA hydratase
MGLHGFSQSLAKEGEKRNIKVNTIAPIAGTRMTETVMPKELIDALKPDFVAPFVAVLAHESCPESGSLFEVGAGYVAKQRWNRSDGLLLPVEQFTPENISKNWNQVVDFSKNSSFPETSNELMSKIMVNIEAATQKREEAAKKALAAATPQSSSNLKSDEIFGMMRVFLERGEGKPLIPKVAAIFGFEILK